MADHFDLVVIGGGAAGLLAAVAARRMGRTVLVLEASGFAGGATAVSDGRLWLPGNPLAAKAGIPDSIEDAATYLDAQAGPGTPILAQRRQVLLRTSGTLARWLMSSKVPLTLVKGVPDHQPELPGGTRQGRVLATATLDRRVLGAWSTALAPGDAHRPGPLRLVPLPRHTATAGEALAGHLLHRATANGVDLRLNSPVTELMVEGSRVTGVVATRDGVDVDVSADQVLLASGGFEASQPLREEYLPLPTQAAWSASGVANLGDLLAQAMAVGAAAEGLDDAWWTPVLVVDGVAHHLDEVRGKPGCLVVDAAGDRFFDEAAPDYLAARALYDRNRGVRAVPSFLILDSRHRKAHALGPWPAGTAARKAQEAGDVVRAGSLNDLAQELGIDRAGLLGTVVRYNGFAAKGRDQDFGRGDSAWDGFLGEPGRRKNPNLGKVDKPPFWGVRVHPGDQGTKGGLVIDADSRVLRSDGGPIEGLYACGGAAASGYPGVSPAPGAALAAALVEAFLAATDRRPGKESTGSG